MKVHSLIGVCWGQTWYVSCTGLSKGSCNHLPVKLSATTDTDVPVLMFYFLLVDCHSVCSTNVDHFALLILTTQLVVLMWMLYAYDDVTGLCSYLM